MKRRIIDKRNKEKFQVDDAYFNGMARYCGISATAVYMVLCRHADTAQQAFPSKKLMAEKLGISPRTIFDAVKKLVKYNIINVEEQNRKKDGSFNVKNYILIDKSEWNYPQANSAIGKKQHSPQANNDTSRGQILPNKETHIKETHIKEEENFIYSSDFEKFWLIYPKRNGKGKAYESWQKIKPNAVLQAKILEAVKQQKKSRQWKEEQGRFIPYPATWLNQRRWEDGEIIKKDDW